MVVTDRLHGHILCSLLDIPHVLLDNADQKLSAYHNTWTRGIRNCRLADNPQDAARLAMELLAEYGPTLPKRLTAVDIDENDVNDVRVVKNNTGTWMKRNVSLLRWKERDWWRWTLRGVVNDASEVKDNTSAWNEYSTFCFGAELWPTRRQCG